MPSEHDDCRVRGAYCVKYGDQLSFIHLERGVAEGIADPTSTHPNRRLVELWLRDSNS